jgi:acyl-CoA thioesterase I
MFPPIVRKTFGLNRRFFLIFEPLLASAQLVTACVTAYFILSVAADAQIVASGASDVAGYSVMPWQAWPAQLQDMLKARGYNVHVKNAGKPGDVPSGLLRRLNSAVPAGTKIVILGREGLYDNNQKAKLVIQLRGDADMKAVEAELKSRAITIIPANSAVLLRDPAYRNDYIHLSPAGHKELATRLLPLVISAL